ncbi:restriction endonuclease [Nocardioides eburneiflavus]|uniref:Restriction endonuclease n=1 Tax=Nocardioides eburneiflavus TaxID=2518372 RepID=A0A4Z1C1X4_9ACTN|nr:NgoMIV family type II restriction endonuclease [Nocardioides eburneiflavus]TGN64234.1 restriction endonuclease [Nocardioides eburneiflavus]
MTAPFATQLLGWKETRGRLVPNTADTSSATSMGLAAATLDNLGVNRHVASNVPADPGGHLETMCGQDLGVALLDRAPEREWDVRCGVLISNFAQYAHLNELDRLVVAQPELRVTIGRDYLIRPDVTVAILPTPGDFGQDPFLHGVVSCKWTIRSDRVQNIRHEFGQMIRHRRGRQPHLVTLTAEPLPTRLASIARGTGEVDATYHIAFEALAQAVAEVGNPEQRSAWDECVGQGRLRPYSDLAETLARW